MNRIAVMAGATGLVGRQCLETLLDDDGYARVVAIVRRAVGLRNAKLEQVTLTFERLAEQACPRCDVAYCALGTTIRTAGSQEAFRRVDFEYVRAFARWAHAGGAPVFAMVSAVGADEHSRNFYLRVKGEAERAIADVGFREVHLFRPSFLFGKRGEFRLGEVVGVPVFRALSYLMMGGFRKYRPVAARDVARAMVQAGASARPGVHVYHYDEIRALGRG